MTNPFPVMTNSFPVMTNPFPVMTNPFPVMTNPFPVMTNPFPNIKFDFARSLSKPPVGSVLNEIFCKVILKFLNFYTCIE